jgi:hypothetical protein
MPRFVVMLDGRWVTTPGGPSEKVGLTARREDASSWATYETALEAAKKVAARTSGLAVVHTVEEPAYT